MRIGAAVAAVLLAVPLAALAACPPSNGRDAPACDAGRSRAAIAACSGDAALSERCADRLNGTVHLAYEARAMSEYVKAGIAVGARTPRGRRWLAHSTVLAERIQDDPAAGPLRAFAKQQEAKAKRALFGR